MWWMESDKRPIRKSVNSSEVSGPADQKTPWQTSDPALHHAVGRHADAQTGSSEPHSFAGSVWP